MEGNHTLESDEDRRDFLCSCCFNLMTKPTSLMCGHNFCRGCLASWYLSSKKKECPYCRQTWHGHPRVNLTLRNMMLRMFKSEVEVLESQLDLNEDMRKKLEDFDQQLSNTQEQADPKAFCTGIIITLLAILVVYLAWFWRNSDQDLLIKKPLWSWKQDDVNKWLRELTWAKEYSQYVSKEDIDGSMLMALDEKSLREKLHIENPLHSRALFLAIKGMAETGVKYPTNLWEYKSLYPGMSLFLLYGLKDFPRTTLLYLYLFKYDEIFLPFLHYTTRTDDSVFVDPTVNKPATWQMITFVFHGLILPYYLVGKYSWMMYGVHKWTNWFVLFSCFLLSNLEICEIHNILKEQNRVRAFIELIRKHFKTLASMSIFVVLWPVIPRLVCDFFFYAALYFAPIQYAIQIKNISGITTRNISYR